MLEILIVIGSFLELFERKNPGIFWLLTSLLGLTFSSFDDRSLIRFETPQTRIVIEKNGSSVLAINSRGDGRASSNSSYSPDEYDFLLGGGNDVSLAAFPEKSLVDYKLTMDSDSNDNPRLNANLTLVAEDPKNPKLR